MKQSTLNFQNDRSFRVSVKYKLYTFSGVMYVVPLDKYEYIDDIAESYFKDYCAGLFTSQELDRFVE